MTVQRFYETGKRKKILEIFKSEFWKLANKGVPKKEYGFQNGIWKFLIESMARYLHSSMIETISDINGFFTGTPVEFPQSWFK